MLRVVIVLVACVTVSLAIPWDELATLASARDVSVCRELLASVVWQCRVLGDNLQSSVPQLELPRRATLLANLATLSSAGQPYVLVVSKKDGRLFASALEPWVLAQEISRVDWSAGFRVGPDNTAGCLVDLDGQQVWAAQCGLVRRLWRLLKTIPLSVLARTARANAIEQLRWIGADCCAEIAKLARPWTEAQSPLPVQSQLHEIEYTLGISVQWGRPAPKIPLTHLNASTPSELLQFVTAAQLAAAADLYPGFSWRPLNAFWNVATEKVVASNRIIEVAEWCARLSSPEEARVQLWGSVGFILAHEWEHARLVNEAEADVQALETVLSLFPQSQHPRLCSVVRETLEEVRRELSGQVPSPRDPHPEVTQRWSRLARRCRGTE